MKKRKLSQQQEFDILKLVIDKFLWFGLLIMVFGLYQLVSVFDIAQGIWYLVAGALVLIVLLVLLVREYEFAKK